MLRPARSVRSAPTSRDSAETAADTDGWLTASSSAAAVTDPVRKTARKLWSCVSVIAILLTENSDLSKFTEPSPRWHGAGQSARRADPPRPGLWCRRRLRRSPTLWTGCWKLVHCRNVAPRSGRRRRPRRGGYGGPLNHAEPGADG